MEESGKDEENKEEKSVEKKGEMYCVKDYHLHS
jgi:hypothetical protein